VDPKPLYVDLDGTLIKSDLLHESLLGLLKRNPLALCLLPLWLWNGRAHMKRAIAERVSIDVASLPYSESFLAYLKQESAAGRKLVLATASDAKYASQVADHLGLFKATLASNGKSNLSGSQKAIAIAADAGGQPFEYAGNSRKDVPIWEKADGAVLVNPDRGVESALGGRTPVTARFTDRRPRFSAYLAALRPHQWVKNALLAVPLLASHRIGDFDAVLHVLVGILAFSLTASSVYVLNDLFDLGADRRHPRKRKRPFAAGDLPITYGLIALPVLIVLGLGIAATVSIEFLGVLLGYLAMTLAYSFRLKHYALIDVMLLTALFTARVVAGGVAIDAFPSYWLLAFCVFLFTSLALVKRCSELVTMSRQRVEAAVGRDYRVSDSIPLFAMGIASGYLAVLVVALYINSSAVTALYSRPEALWLLCPVMLYWVSRLWLKTSRGEMHDDPMVFAVTDRASLYLAAAGAAILLVAV
jgi:4-hydroxybenzoate polyprenyltransferase